MIKNFIRTFRSFSRDVKLHLLASMLLGFSYFGFVAVLLNLYLVRLGYDERFIGLVNAGAPIAFATCSVPAGLLGQRIGSRRAIILGITLLAFSMGLMPLAELLPLAWQNSGFFVARLLTGLGFALYMVNTNPYLVAATTLEERNQVFSLQVGLLPVAGFVGSVISGIMPSLFANWLNVPLSDPAPYRYPLIFASFMLLPAALVLFTTSEAEYDQKETVAAAASQKKRETQSSAPRGRSYGVPLLIIGVLAVTALFRMTGEGAARTFFNVYLDTGMGVSAVTIGVVMAIGQVVAGPAALIAPQLVARNGKVRTVCFATGGIALSLVIMAFAPHWAGVSIGFIGVLGMLSVSRAITNVIYMEIVPDDWRSLTSGVTSSAMGIGFASMAYGGGFVITAFGYKTLFLIGACAVTFSTALFWFYFRTPRGEYAREEVRIEHPVPIRA